MGSIPGLQFAIMLILPVGAIVVVLVFLINCLLCFVFHTDSSKAGKFPFSLAISSLALWALSCINFITVFAASMDSSSVYELPRFAR